MFKQEITVAAAVENLGAVTAFVDRCMEELGCSVRSQVQIDVAVDELFSNIAYYAYPPGTGTVTLRVEVAEDPSLAILTFIDSGVPYDPLSRPDPDTTLSAEERRIGGLGIYMVKKSMDDVSYAYEDGKNVFTIKKRL